MSAGGYHHHLGLNTWNSAGSGPPAPGSVGLRSFEVVLPEPRRLDAVLARVADAGLEIETGRRARRQPLVRDPSGNRGRAPLRLSAARRAQTGGATLATSATWRSGYAAACKAVYTGSIPVVASG